MCAHKLFCTILISLGSVLVTAKAGADCAQPLHRNLQEIRNLDVGAVFSLSDKDSLQSLLTLYRCPLAWSLAIVHLFSRSEKLSVFRIQCNPFSLD